MAYEIATVVPAGGLLAHHKLVEAFHNLALANGWTILRYLTAGTDHELIMMAPGLTGTEQIFVGIKTYQSIPGDYYNLQLGTFTGYVAGNSFETQPGARLSGCPAHNNSITYYVAINGQRLVFMLKVGTPVYVHGYLGKFLPYARPGEFPYPVICAGVFSGAVATRFSDASLYFPYHGLTVSGNTNCYMRRPLGDWYSPAMWPFSHGGATDSYGTNVAGSVGIGCQVPANGKYQVEAIVLHDRVTSPSLTADIWGELDGVYFVSGYNNTVENILQVGGDSVVDQTGLTQLEAVQAIKLVNGRAFVMGQNIGRTSWRDYVAIEM